MADIHVLPGVEVSTADVLEFDGVTRLSVPSDKLLQKALDNGITNVVIIGYDPDGDFYFASSDADGGDVLWLIEMAKRKLFEAAETVRGDL